MDLMTSNYKYYVCQFCFYIFYMIETGKDCKEPCNLSAL